MIDLINPPHYKNHPSGVESIEICERLSYCFGNAVKYLFRANFKGKQLEDLQKCAWYLRRAADTGHFIYSKEIPKLDDVIDAEPPGQVLGDVLRILFWRNDIHRAIARVEREIEVVRERR